MPMVGTIATQQHTLRAPQTPIIVTKRGFARPNGNAWHMAGQVAARVASGAVLPLSPGKARPWYHGLLAALCRTPGRPPRVVQASQQGAKHVTSVC